MSRPIQSNRPARSGRSSPDLLESTRAAIAERLNELRRLVAEVQRLEHALAALQAAERQAERDRPATPKLGRRRGRPRGRRTAGTRADQFLALVRDRPGITVAEAQALGAASTYVHRIAATLHKEGTVRKEGRGFAAPGTASPATPEQPGEGAPVPTGTTVSLPESGT